MRIAVLGDLHGNLAALEAVLAAAADEGAGTVLCTGDLVNYGPEPLAVLDRVLEVAAACVAGNHDRLLAAWRGEPLAARPGRDAAAEEACLRWTAGRLDAAGRRRLAGLPATATWPPAEPWLLLAHGSPLRVDEYVRPDLAPERWPALAAAVRGAGAAVVALGHTHEPMDAVREGVRFLNPGSAGWPKDGDPRASWGLIELAPDGSCSFTPRRTAYDVGSTVAAMRRAGLPETVAAGIAAGRPA